MNIEIPVTLAAHTATLKEFFEGMVFKLHVNAHKDEVNDKSVPGLIDHMLAELQELKDEITEDGHINSDALAETFDGANFWYLIFQFLRKSGVPDERERFIKEYFRPDFTSGKIYAAKTRSGSRYREGDEIAGTYRKGRCYIRTQHAVSGCAVSLPRDHILWWLFCGSWPSGELAHLDCDLGNDAIDNLRLGKDPRVDREFPFVSQWKPRGKEHHSHYGKYCYQRRHNLILVKVGYYDTPEEAARQGLKDWKQKTKEEVNGD